MRSTRQDLNESDETPVTTIRGRLRLSPSDSPSPVAGMLFAIAAGVAATGFALSSFGTIPAGTQTYLYVVAGLIAVLLIVGFLGWRSGRDELEIFDDRTVLRPGGRRGPARIIPHAELQHLALDKAWIRLRQRDGRLTAFRAPRLQAEDAFDTLAERVEAVQPECTIQGR